MPSHLTKVIFPCHCSLNNTGFPWCLDGATSVVQRGKIEMYEREGKDCPVGWVINQEGKFVTDTPKILKELVSGECACLPVGGVGEDTGGYKGYGFATVVEIMSSCLQAGNFMLDLTGVKVQVYLRSHI